MSGHVNHERHVQVRDPGRAEEKLIQLDGDARGAGTAVRVGPYVCHAL